MAYEDPTYISINTLESLYEVEVNPYASENDPEKYRYRNRIHSNDTPWKYSSKMPEEMIPRR